jgi:hypothetical protein
MVVAVRVVMGVVVRCSMRVVAMGAVVTLYAVGTLAMTVTSPMCRVMRMLENVLRKGGRNWRQSVARSLTEMSLERRLHRCAYRRLWSSE